MKVKEEYIIIFIKQRIYLFFSYGINKGRKVKFYLLEMLYVWYFYKNFEIYDPDVNYLHYVTEELSNSILSLCLNSRTPPLSGGFLAEVFRSFPQLKDKCHEICTQPPRSFHYHTYH